MRVLLALAVVCAAMPVIFMAAPAGAHGMGQRYDLPLPLGLFVAGGALAVLLSFVIAALFVRRRAGTAGYARLPVATLPSAVVQAIQAIAVAVFVLTLAGGFIGAANPYRNITTVMVWVIGWVGLAFVCSLLGNAWAVINPWRILFDWAGRLAGRPVSANLPYPAWLGAWPAVILFFIFAWGEINWPGSGIPRNLSVALAIYSAITWIGMALFGRDAWLARSEAFSIAFGLFGRFAVIEGERRDGRVRLRLRPPAVGLIVTEPPSFSLMVFVLLVLATVTYDGFTETEAFSAAALALFQTLQVVGAAAVPMVGTIGLASFPLLFLLAYLAFSALVWAAGGRAVPLRRVAPMFVFSLLPIAIAYHLAHYLSLLVFDGQNAIALVSDPFGFGWDLFGTAQRRVDLTVMDAGFVWYFSVSAIVAGHIAAVYLAHVEAMLLFQDRRRAFASQMPMVVLMVGYTMLSLWIIAQPIVS